MIDEEIRRLERALAADPSDAMALEALAAARTRAGRGWADEPLPLDLLCSARERGVYVWERHGLGLELVLVPGGPSTECDHCTTRDGIGNGKGLRWSDSVMDFIYSCRPEEGECDGSGRVPGPPMFYVGRHPVTWGEWLRWPTRRIPTGVDVDQADYPVVNVTHADALAFCSWAGLRLPTAAEWTRAALGDGRAPCLCPCKTHARGAHHFPATAPIDRASWLGTCDCGGTGFVPRLFPWGNEAPTPERCVSAWWDAIESGAIAWLASNEPDAIDEAPLRAERKAVAVRISESRPARPLGASPCGAHDMVGHVFQFADVGPHVHDLMGSSFRRQREDIGFSRTTDGSDDIGFRVALSEPTA